MIYLDSLLRSAQNSRKCSFLDNLKTIIQEGNLEARQMTPFFFIYFFSLFVTFISEFKNTQNSFSPLWFILVCKISQFLARSYRFGQLIIIFLKVETLRLLITYIMFCPPAGAKYPFLYAPAHGLLFILHQQVTQDLRYISD